MKKLAIVFAFALVAAACGGGDDGADGGTTATDNGTTASTAATTATTQATTQATTSNTPIFTGDFCDDSNNETLVEGVDFFSQDLEASVNEWLAVINAVEDAAPAEIADDVAVLANAARTFAEVLEEADYQLLNIDQDDPRLTAFDDGTIDEASDNIAEYCGWDPDEFDTGGGDDVGAGGTGGDDIPEGIPAELLPSNITMVQDNGVAGLNIFTEDSYDDLVAKYTELIADPTEDTGTQALFEGSVDSSMLFISVTDADDVRIVTIIII